MMTESLVIMIPIFFFSSTFKKDILFSLYFIFNELLFQFRGGRIALHFSSHADFSRVGREAKNAQRIWRAKNEEME